MNRIFPRNENGIERFFRIIAGLIILSLVFIGPQTSWGWLGLMPLLTGIAGSCPLYTVFGLSTCKLKKSSGSDLKKEIIEIN
ncbi:MAG: DUF2892 domain-containing protein [Deltaproteobacteria bacterium]|nr:DUF2892 domain-containing protein [Deltaproteobacteria bacterium]